LNAVRPVFQVGATKGGSDNMVLVKDLTRALPPEYHVTRRRKYAGLEA
jgi:hypothetical protein